MRRTPAREWLHQIVFNSETPGAQAYDIVLLLCIGSSVTLTMLDSVHWIRSEFAHFFRAAEITFLSTFTGEYLLRLAVAKPTPWSYASSFLGAVDLLAILPTLLEELLRLQPSTVRLVRVLRLLRAVRMLHAFGLEDEAKALGAAVWAGRRKIFVFLITLLGICCVCGTLMYVLEDAKSGFTSIPRAIYWAIVTVTTVGYGDIAPKSIPGQALASAMMVIGYSLLAVPTGLAAADYTLSSEAAGHGLTRADRARNARSRMRYGCREGVDSSQQGSYAEIVPVRTCANCRAAGHDSDALFCKHCGQPLVSLSVARLSDTAAP